MLSNSITFSRKPMGSRELLNRKIEEDSGVRLHKFTKYIKI